ncbi:MAG: hypothetical protein ACI9SQ_001614 [Rubritalea sp.]|jgi:hypothetical protein
MQKIDEKIRALKFVIFKILSNSTTTDRSKSLIHFKLVKNFTKLFGLTKRWLPKRQSLPMFLKA